MTSLIVSKVSAQINSPTQTLGWNRTKCIQGELALHVFNSTGILFSCQLALSTYYWAIYDMRAVFETYLISFQPFEGTRQISRSEAFFSG